MVGAWGYVASASESQAADHIASIREYCRSNGFHIAGIEQERTLAVQAAIGLPSGLGRVLQALDGRRVSVLVLPTLEHLGDAVAFQEVILHIVRRRGVKVEVLYQADGRIDPARLLAREVLALHENLENLLARRPGVVDVSNRVSDLSRLSTPGLGRGWKLGPGGPP